VTHDAADNDSARVDLLYWNYAGVVKIEKGVNGSPAVAPSLPAGGTIISFDTVAAGVSAVALAKIADKRQTSMRLYPADGVVGIGTDTVVKQWAGARTLAIRGTTFAGMEFTTEAADATGVNVALLDFTDKNNTASDPRAANIQVQLRGGTSNNRGGRMIFNVRPDGGSAPLEAVRIDTNRSTMFGGGNVIVNKANTAEVAIDGTDGALTSGVASVFESGGDLTVTGRGSLIMRIDNDSNATSALFRIRTNTYNTTDLFTVNETGGIGIINRGATEGSYGVGAILDTVMRAAQTAAISATNFTSASVATIYRVTAYAECTTLSGSGSPTLDVIITYTDDVGATTHKIIDGLSLSATGRAHNVDTYLIASGNLQWSTAINSASGTPQYKIYLVCERLN
jgi:hypothetical protein